jgi:hypothetical protein
MLTPQQFRENARQNLADAQALLEQSPRNAAYLAGYSVEFMLKARYCTLRGWSRFPSGVTELVEWNKRDGVTMADKLFVHDLEALLRLSDSVSLKTSSFHRIDWDRASDWSEHIRYEPPGSVTREEAAELITEVTKLCDELTVFDLLKSLWNIEVDTSKRFGPFHCFALVKHPQTAAWIVLAAWYARTQREWDLRAEALHKAIGEQIDADLRALITGVEILDPKHPVLQGLYQLLGMIGGGILHSPRSMVARNIVVGFPMFPDGFVVTAGSWSPDSLEAAWKEATDLRNDNTGNSDAAPKV